MSVRPSREDLVELSGLVQSGQFPKAEARALELTQSHPDAPVPWNLLGAAVASQGDYDRAIANYHEALRLKPDYADAHFNLGCAHRDMDNLVEAVSSFAQAIRFSPKFAQAHFNLGNIFRQQGKLNRALASYGQAVKVRPDFARAHNNLASLLLDLERYEDAVTHCREALRLDPKSVEAYFNLGGSLHSLGRLARAAESFERAVQISPEFAKAHNSLGVVYQQLGRLDDAIDCYRKALAIDADYVRAHNNLALAYRDQGDTVLAAASLRRALVIEPDYPQTYFNLAELLEQSNQEDALRDLVIEAQQNCKPHPRIAYIQARILKRDGMIAEARHILEEHYDPKNEPGFKAARGYLLGELHDRLGKSDDAFRTFKLANLEAAKSVTPEKLAQGRYLEHLDDLAKQFTPDWVAGWRKHDIQKARPAPVFLVGFPRSGTNLLDTILRSHPSIAVAEELPMLHEVEQRARRLPGGYPDALATVGHAQLADLESCYFAELDRHLNEQERSKVVVDKLPLNIIRAGLVHRVFPDARFIFVQRHPCDCVLSCYMQNFRLNDAMVNFLDLEGAAKTYGKVMELWQQYRSVLQLNVVTVRYEDLVETFDDTMRPVLAFLGVGWDDAVRDYAATARSRERIRTPSYDQATQPIYGRAKDRWRRYKKHLEPVLPMLEPWAERFGYSVD